jgi:hypothetical protein
VNTSFWKCPRCGRQFLRKGQVHSCVFFPIDYHFDNKPAKLKKIFDLVLQELRKNGPLRVDAVKSGINLAGKSHFGEVHVLRDRLNLGFVMSRKIDNPRIRRVQKITDRTYFHTVNLKELSDIDAQLLNWLKEAYLQKELDS